MVKTKSSHNQRGGKLTSKKEETHLKVKMPPGEDNCQQQNYIKPQYAH